MRNSQRRRPFLDRVPSTDTKGLSLPTTMSAANLVESVLPVSFFFFSLHVGQRALRRGFKFYGVVSVLFDKSAETRAVSREKVRPFSRAAK